MGFVCLKERPSAGPGRVVLVVSTKTARRAVRRNLLKRRVRHIIREAIRTMNWVCRPNRDYFFYFKPGSAELSFADLKDEILLLLTS